MTEQVNAGAKQNAQEQGEPHKKKAPPRPVHKPGGPPKAPSAKPVAEPAKARRRHRGLILSFALYVLLPFIASVFYLFVISQDQYASTTGFTVRQEDSASASDVLSGFSQFVGGGGGSESDILYEYIQSQEIVSRIDDSIDLRAKFSEGWGTDPVFSLWPDASIEDLLWFWKRSVRIAYDKSTTLIELRVLTHDPDLSQAIATHIVAESEEMINGLNFAAQRDATRYALADLEEARDRVKEARENLTGFRNRTQIVDPTADLQGRMGILQNLQQQLAEAMIEFDLLIGTVQEGDPRVTQMRQRIEVIQARVVVERDRLASGDNAAGENNYPVLIAEFERLAADREFAETTYQTALAAYEIARSQASRNSSYLAAYIQPTRAETAEFPQRFTLTALAGLFLLASWMIMVLVYYSARDRR